MENSSSRDAEVSFAIDLTSREVTRLPDVRLSEIGIRERRDLQRWIEDHPEIVGRDLLVVTTEFDQWESREARVADRLDVLFLDSFGSLLVAELKRDEAAETTDLQALKYAAYCSQLRVSDVVDMYAKYHGIGQDDAAAQLYDHAPAIEEGELGSVRIRLVAGGFGSNVSTVVLWLNEMGIDIGCVEVRARHLSEARAAVITARQVLPPPSAEEYLVRRRLRRVEEEEREERSRRRDSVAILLDHEAVEVETELRLRLGEFTGPQRELVQPLLTREPDRARASWTGLSAREALRWKHDGATYSPTALVRKILMDAGVKRSAVPGPRYWALPDGKSLAELAIELEPAVIGAMPGGGEATPSVATTANSGAVRSERLNTEPRRVVGG